MQVAKLTAASDPQTYSRGISDVPPGQVRALALDLSLSCGVAMLDFDPKAPVIGNSLMLDLWNLDVGSFDSNIVRYVRLRQFLSVVQPGVIFFEDVRNDPVTKGPGGKPLPIGMLIARAATSLEMQGAFKATVSVWAEERGIACVGVAPAELKKWATGKGNASKEMMVEACNKKFGTDLPVEDCEKHRSDDMADAAHAMDWGLANYGKGF